MKNGENVPGFELEGHANRGGEEEEDEAERRERPSGEGGFMGCQGRKRGGGGRAITKMPSPTLLFVPSSVIFDTVSLLHNPN